MKTLRFYITLFICFAGLNSFAKDIEVSTTEELLKAVKTAQPGDVIILADQQWNDVKIQLLNSGKAGSPITLRAKTPGKVILSGNSSLVIGADYIIVDGLWFKDGTTTDKPVITFRKNAETPAHYSQVTNCAVTDYNPSDRQSQYQWVELWGKHNRLDHCYFSGKTNQGPVLIVGLRDNQDNLENNHRIDHNYFGFRPPLGANGGETIRVGTSHTSMESSRTIIEDNMFEHCNGEVEIISNKSCDNMIRNNLFVESEGVLTLRHGDRCLVEGNVFYGNNKPHTGGIRVINAGHIVQNNLMIGLKGDGFRGPLVIMNGIFNGPANRYNQVENVVIQNNTFINCSSMEFCAGSDEERTAPPTSTVFANNLFYGNDDIPLFNTYDDISGITFSGNKVQGNYSVNQKGFDKIQIEWENLPSYPIPALSADSVLVVDKTSRPVRTDLTGAVRTKLIAGALSAGNKKQPLALSIQPGVSWEIQKATTHSQATDVEYTTVKVAPGEGTLEKALKKAKDYTILELEAGTYNVLRGMQISNKVIIKGAGESKSIIKVSDNAEKVPGYFFRINEGQNLTVKDLELDGSGKTTVRYGFCSENNPTSKSYKLTLDGVYAHGFTDEASCLYKAYKGTFADSIVIKNSKIEECYRGLNLSYEKDDVGKYNAEVIVLENTLFKNINQFALYYYRGGNDESTLGGQLKVNHCVFYNVDDNEKGRILRTNGIVYVDIANSVFAGSSAKYAVVLEGQHNKIQNSITFNGGDIKTSEGAIKTKIDTKNPQWKDTENFIPKDDSNVKNAASDGKDIGLISDNNSN